MRLRLTNRIRYMRGAAMEMWAEDQATRGRLGVGLVVIHSRAAAACRRACRRQ
jgi:hypothetical protein